MRDNWEDFANAIILKAVDDYRLASRRIRNIPDDEKSRKRIREVEWFFRSEWFRLLSDVDGSTILCNLRREAA